MWIRRFPVWLMLVFTLALCVRCGIAVMLQGALDRSPEKQFLIAGDAEGYWELGKRIANGQDYQLYHPPRQVMRMPGFPAVLAAPMISFGENFLAVRLWLALIGVLACGLVYWLGTFLFDRGIGLIAAVLAAVSPTLAGFSVVVLSETTFAAAILLSLGLMARLTPAFWESTLKKEYRTARWRMALMTGAAIALAVYVRPSWILTAPLFCGVLLWNTRRRRTALAESIVLMTALLAALLPWAVRNQRATGHFVLTTLWSGPSLYDGLHPDADGGSNMAFFDRDRLMDRMSEYEMDQTYRRAAWRFAADHPQRSAELAAIKLWRYFKPWPSAQQFDNPWAAAAVGGFYIPLLLVAGVGGWAHRRCVWRLFLTAGPLFYFAAIHTVFVSSLRYRLPAEYPLCILAAAGIQFIYRKVRKLTPATC